MQQKTNFGSLILLRIACYMSLAISFMPLVNYYCPWYITIFPVAIVLFITFNYEENLYPVLPAFIYILSFGLLEYLIVYRDSSMGYYMINYCIAFIPCLLAIQIGKTVEEKKFYEEYLTVTALFSAITSITTIIGLEIYPMASRELASGTAVYDTEKYTRMNMGGYDYIYAMVIFIPVLMWMIKRANKWLLKALYIVILLLNVYCVYKSQYTIALICIVISFVVVWTDRHNWLARFAIFSALMLFIFFGFSMISDLFKWASESLEGEYLSDRFMQLSQFFAGENINTQTSTERIDHYKEQLEAFWESPLWGHNWFKFDKDYISGHSVILDILGGGGLFAGLLALVFNRRIYSLTFSPLEKKEMPHHLKATWLMLITVAFLNPAIFSTILTIAFMCCMCIYKLENDESNDETQKDFDEGVYEQTADDAKSNPEKGIVENEA